LKRFLLDTIYLMPAIGVSINKISGEDVARFRQGTGVETALCDITIFELSAKAAKLITEGKLKLDAVSAGIEAIDRDDSLIKLRAYDQENLSTAFKLRHTLKDFIDCLIFSTALNQADVLLTEDQLMHELERDEPSFNEIIKTTNPKFEIRRLSDFM
jgi:predicted nucleic acid-binding protein